jgi:hypothetical protein
MKKTIKKAEDGKRIRGKYTPGNEEQANRNIQADKAVRIIKSTQPRTDAAGMQYFGKQVANAMNSSEYKKPESKQPEERVGPIKRAGSPSSTPKPTGGGSGGSKGSEGKKKVARTASAAISAPKREKPSSTISKPSGPGIQKPAKRKFSDSEIKTMEIMQKGKQADGTMSESAQRKIQAVRAKQRASNEKALRKSARASKFNKRVVEKSAKDYARQVKKSAK